MRRFGGFLPPGGGFPPPRGGGPLLLFGGGFLGPLGVGVHLLEDAQDVLHGPVQHEPRGQIVEDEEEHDGHGVGHHLHVRAGRGGAVRGLGEAALDEGGDQHHERQHPDRAELEEQQLDRREVQDALGAGEIVDPPGDEDGAAQLEVGAQEGIHGEENRHLQQQRQASSQGTDAFLLVKRPDLLVHLLGVALVLVPNLVDLGLQSLHARSGLEALVGQREKERLDQNRQQDDRHPVVRNETVEPIEGVLEDLREPAETQEARVEDLLEVQTREGEGVLALIVESGQDLPLLRPHVESEDVGVPGALDLRAAEVHRRAVGEPLDRVGCRR